MFTNMFVYRKAKIYNSTIIILYMSYIGDIIYYTISNKDQGCHVKMLQILEFNMKKKSYNLSKIYFYTINVQKYSFFNGF